MTTCNKPATKNDMDALIKDIEELPDGLQFERAERLVVSIIGIYHALEPLKVTYKNSAAS